LHEIILTTVYLVIGAAIFYGLEHDYAVDSRKSFLQTRNDLFTAGNFTSEQLAIVDELMTKAAQEKYSPYLTVWSEEESDEIWSYGESLYFTLVTVSTVGFGDMSPQTSGGKVFLIFFTIIGIPLMITVNLSLGGYVIWGVFMAMHRLNSVRKWGLEKRSAVGVELSLLGGLLFVAFGLTIFFAGLLMIGQNLNYLDAFYFTWTTLTTIGYGDLTIENNHFITASVLLIVLLAISFAAGSALVALLTRALHFVDISRERAKSASSQAALMAAGMVEMKEMSKARDDSVIDDHGGPHVIDDNKVGQGGEEDVEGEMKEVAL